MYFHTVRQDEVFLKSVNLGGSFTHILQGNLKSRQGEENASGTVSDISKNFWATFISSFHPQTSLITMISIT